jgi:beta-glucanase (GH16 family)
VDSNHRAPRTPWEPDVPERVWRTRPAPLGAVPRPRASRLRLPVVIGVAVAAAVAVAGCAPVGSSRATLPSFDAAATAGPTADTGTTAGPGAGGTDRAATVPQPGSFDEFDGTAGSAPDPAHWSAQTGAGGWGNRELQTYTGQNAVLDGHGHLVITADIGPGGGPPYTSARLTTHGKRAFGLGTVSARIRVPDGRSLVPAFWMLGSDIDTVGWPACGEIDVVEAPIDTHRTSHFVHGPGKSDPDRNVQAGGVLIHDRPMSDGFHTYSITRSPGHVVISVDGVVGTDITEASAPADLRWVFDGDEDLLLSMAIGGSVTHPTASTPRTARMLVDWIRYAPAH